MQTPYRLISTPKRIRTLFFHFFFNLVLVFLVSTGGAAQTKTTDLSLTEGDFEMRATYKFSDQNEPTVNFGGNVSIKVKGKQLSIKVPIFEQPIKMKLSDGVYKGTFSNAGAVIEFRCEIVAMDHTEGVFSGSFGPKKVTGIWTMKRSKIQPNQKANT